jgi:hypothetical protein
MRRWIESARERPPAERVVLRVVASEFSHRGWRLFFA